MNQIEAEKLEEFFCTLKGAQNPLLLLDYDGTLADFRINRFTARPWAGVRELLNEIQQDNRTRLSVITGRPAAEINTMLTLNAPVDVWGLHGAERLHEDGRHEIQEAPAEAQAKLDELREKLKLYAFGGLFEDKPNAAVMHWRGHTPRQAKHIEQKTRELFEPAAQVSGLSLLDFESGIELRVGRDKGGAVEAILEAAEPGTPVVYLGDDLTDEAAFCVVNQAMGPHLSVLMRREWRQTAADIWMQPPLELRWFLERWLDATSQKRRVDGSRKHPTAGPAHRHSFPVNGSKSDHDVAEPVHEESRLQD